MRRNLLRLLGLGRSPSAALARPRRPRKQARPRDFQRTRVYRWEAEHVFPYAGERLSLAACRALVEAAYRWREEPGGDPAWSPPQVTDGRSRRHACGSREAIKLPRWARTTAIVLHECAHGMADDQHGPKFVATYVALLVRFAGFEPSQLLVTLERAGVTATPTLTPS